MRAVVLKEIGGPDVLRLVELPVPEPGAGEVRVRVAFCALNPMDANARSGRMKWGVPPLPFTLGYEYSGRVDAAGTGVDPAWVGKRVSVIGAWGGCAEFAVAPVSRLMQLPDALSYEVGAAYGSATLAAWHALHTVGRVSAGMVVVLHSAAGSVGAMAAQIANEVGATVIGLVGSPEKVDAARSNGCDHVIDYRAEPAWAAPVRALNGGRGADLIVDGVQGPGAAENLEALAPLGTIVYLGAASGEQAPAVSVPQLIARSATVSGLVMYEAMARTGGSELPIIQAKLAQGIWRVPFNPAIPLDRAPEAHERFEARRTSGRDLFIVAEDV